MIASNKIDQNSAKHLSSSLPLSLENALFSLACFSRISTPSSQRFTSLQFLTPSLPSHVSIPILTLRSSFPESPFSQPSASQNNFLSQLQKYLPTAAQAPYPAASQKYPLAVQAPHPTASLHYPTQKASPLTEKNPLKISLNRQKKHPSPTLLSTAKYASDSPFPGVDPWLALKSTTLIPWWPIRDWHVDA